MRDKVSVYNCSSSSVRIHSMLIDNKTTPKGSMPHFAKHAEHLAKNSESLHLKREIESMQQEK